MNKAELAAKIADKHGLSKKQAEEILDSFTDMVTDELKANHVVTLTGFGKFSSMTRKARSGVNPQNLSQKIQIEAVRVAKFKTGKALKDALKSKA